MGCTSSKAAASYEATKKEREEAALGPPSKTMDATEHAQTLVMLVSGMVQADLGLLRPLQDLKATQMITRSVDNSVDPSANGGTMYYVKVRTDLEDWPWLFVKIFEPPQVTDVSPVAFKGLKKMKDDFALVTF